MYGAKELQESYRAATRSVTRRFNFENNKTMPEHPKVDQSFIGFISAKELLNIISLNDSDNIDSMSINSTVFFDNIRDFDSKSKINNSIINEIVSGDNNGFVFRNNGVTVVSKKINRTGDNFRIEDFQIVNGCQTCNILYEARKNIQDISVPFRLIGSTDDDFITSIIIGTNSQNPVKEEQFWALRPFLKNLEEYSKEKDNDSKLFIERRENQYRNESIERTRIIKPSDLIKAIASVYLFKPQRAARDFRRIKSEFSESLFLDDHDVNVYYAAALLSYKFDFLTRNKKIERSLAVYKYYILSMIGWSATKGKDIFGLKKSQASKASKEIISIANDESLLIEKCNSVSLSLIHVVENRHKESLVNIPRERLRDTLRSENLWNELLTTS